MLLSQLRELLILVVTRNFGNREDSDPIPADKRLQIITSFFESCENLNEIHFSLNSRSYQMYRWVAGSLDIQPTQTSYTEVHRWWDIM